MATTALLQRTGSFVAGAGAWFASRRVPFRCRATRPFTATTLLVGGMAAALISTVLGVVYLVCVADSFAVTLYLPPFYRSARRGFGGYIAIIQ